MSSVFSNLRALKFKDVTASYPEVMLTNFENFNNTDIEKFSVVVFDLLMTEIYQADWKWIGKKFGTLGDYLAVVSQVLELESLIKPMYDSQLENMMWHVKSFSRLGYAQEIYKNPKAYLAIIVNRLKNELESKDWFNH